MAGKSNHTVWADKQVFTTGEAARICKVSQQTIIRCFDNGRLHGFRVPGSRFRRIPRAELLRFMQANNIPADALEGPGRKRVLVVDDDEQIVALFVEALAKDQRFEVRSCSSGYDAGVLTERFKPHLIVLDYMLPDVGGNVVCRRIRSNPELKDTKIVIISGALNPDGVEEIKSADADEFVRKPFDIVSLVETIAELTDA